MANEQDQARSIAERVARRVGGERSGKPEGSAKSSGTKGPPVGEELSAIRSGLHDLERKLERIESKIVAGASDAPSAPTRARVVDFISSSPPPAIVPTISSARAPASVETIPEPPEFVPATHSPWLRNFNATVAHPSQEHFGIEEATVAELVEFFESEKKCSVEPGGKPCDHCSMCSSRGF